LNRKETKIMDILHNERQFAAIYPDDLTINEALAYEYAVILDLQKYFTNNATSEQSNQVMFEKHPTTAERISRIILEECSCL
uniref:Transcriptional regulator n=1 Tax=Rhabditophanes sp. KR3021 TaxID=114890 RepID=A0AC35THK2_9BILA